MKKYRRTTTATLTSSGLGLRKRLARNRRRAKLVGALYFLAIVALAAAACFPLLVHDLAPVGVMEFYKTFLPANLSLKTTEGLTKAIVSGLYALMLLGVVINVLKALGKLGWLCKKKGNKTYGFNRNVYAMDDLGRIFSGSYSVIIITYVLIGILCGSFAINTMMYIVAGGGAALRLLTGFWGAKTGYYDYEDGEVIEHKRVVGRFAPIFRNLLQLAACAAIVYFIDFAGLNETVTGAMSKAGLSDLLKDMNKLIMLAAQVVMVLCLFVLIKHASGITEYSNDGAKGVGMKNFKAFSFLTFLAAGGAVAYKYFVIAGKVLDKNLAIIAGIALFMFLVEAIMSKMPRFPDDKKKKKKEEEFTFESLVRAKQKQQEQAKALQQQAQPTQA